MTASAQFRISSTILTLIGLILLALALGGCSTTQHIPVVVDLPKASLPPECALGSKQWNELPDKGVSKSEITALWVRNRRQYSALRNRHGVCRRFAFQHAAKTAPQEKKSEKPRWFLGL